MMSCSGLPERPFWNLDGIHRFCLNTYQRYTLQGWEIALFETVSKQKMSPLGDCTIVKVSNQLSFNKASTPW